MALKTTKETWGKCGIQTIEYYNKKEDIIELWNKMRDVEIQRNHININDLALKRIRKYCGKKTKDIEGEEKEKYKAFLKVKQVFSLLKNLRVI